MDKELERKYTDGILSIARAEVAIAQNNAETWNAALARNPVDAMIEIDRLYKAQAKIWVWEGAVDFIERRSYNFTMLKQFFLNEILDRVKYDDTHNPGRAAWNAAVRLAYAEGYQKMCNL